MVQLFNEKCFSPEAYAKTRWKRFSREFFSNLFFLRIFRDYCCVKSDNELTREMFLRFKSRFSFCVKGKWHK